MPAYEHSNLLGLYRVRTRSLALGFQSQEAIAEFGVLTTYQRFVFAAHGFYMYWVKMLLPFNLSAFYPYPSLEGNGNLPFLYYLAPFVAVAVVAVPLYLLRSGCT